MDPYANARQIFARLYGRRPNEVEVADTVLAMAAFLYLGNLSEQQICQRVAAMLTPGTPLHNFMTHVVAIPVDE